MSKTLQERAEDIALLDSKRTKTQLICELLYDGYIKIYTDHISPDLNDADADFIYNAPEMAQLIKDQQRRISVLETTLDIMERAYNSEKDE